MTFSDLEQLVSGYVAQYCCMISFCTLAELPFVFCNIPVLCDVGLVHIALVVKWELLGACG